MARYLSNLGYELVLVARNEERLKLLSNELKTKSKIIPMDLKQKENCYELFKQENNIDVLINNAGFGIFGRFDNTDIEKELELINTNIVAMHILFKVLVARIFIKFSSTAQRPNELCISECELEKPSTISFMKLWLYGFDQQGTKIL